jgi:hypothetical protein
MRGAGCTERGGDPPDWVPPGPGGEDSPSLEEGLLKNMPVRKNSNPENFLNKNTGLKTDKKESKIFLIYKEIHRGAAVKSNITYGLLKND